MEEMQGNCLNHLGRAGRRVKPVAKVAVYIQGEQEGKWDFCCPALGPKYERFSFGSQFCHRFAKWLLPSHLITVCLTKLEIIILPLPCLVIFVTSLGLRNHIWCEGVQE